MWIGRAWHPPMTAKKRDQPHHDLVRQCLPGLILNTVPGIIRELGDPYDAKPGLGGMTAYPPMSMATVCIMLEAERATYRKMVGIPSRNHVMTANMHRDCIRCRRPENRAREISIRATCYKALFKIVDQAKFNPVCAHQITIIEEPASTPCA